MNKLTRILMMTALVLSLPLSATSNSRGAEPDAASASALADTTLKPFPPYVAPVGENADWVVRIVPPKEAAPTPATAAEIPVIPSITDASDTSISDLVTEIRNTKVGDLQRAIVLRKGGTSTEYYHLKNFNLTPAGDKSGKVMVVQQNAGLPPYAFFAKGYYGVSWIKPEYFVSVSTYKEAKCFHYKGQQGAEAWVDCKTQLPVAVKIDNELVEFLHNPAAKQLELPPPFQAAWKFHENQQRRLNSIGVVR